MADNAAMNGTAESDETEVLQVSTHEQAGVPIVMAQGDVDLCTTPTLRLALETACANRGDMGAVGIDMREVSFIDSAGLALLVEIRKRFIDRCRLALIIEKGSQPERVLRLGRFDTFLQVCYSPEELAGTAVAVAA